MRLFVTIYLPFVHLTSLCIFLLCLWMDFYTKIAELTIFGLPMRRCLNFCCIRTPLEQHQVHANSLENKTLNHWSMNSPPPSDVRRPLVCRCQALPPPKEHFTSCKQNLPLLESTDMPDWFPFFLMLQPRYTYCPFGPRTIELIRFRPRASTTSVNSRSMLTPARGKITIAHVSNSSFSPGLAASTPSRICF